MRASAGSYSKAASAALNAWRRTFGRLVRDRKGAVSLVFTVSAVALIGLAGFATEGGTRYLEKRHGQNAADAAAIAGVLALAATADPVAGGQAIATKNGYSTGVTINNPPASGPFAGDANAVEAIVTRSPTRLFSSLFLGNGNTTITERAEARLDTVGPACVLSLVSPLSFGGNTTVIAPDCSMASNNTSSTSVSCGGSSSVTAAGFVSEGGVSGCGGTVSAYQPPTTDPFRAANSVAMPPESATGPNCQNMPPFVGGVANMTSTNTYEVGTKMFCNSDLKLNAGNTMNLVPGTYILYNSNIKITGGSLLCPTCTPGGSGVTIILTGSPASKIGNIDMNGNGTEILNAPKVNAFNAAFDGVLFYVDNRATSSTVKINGTSTSSLSGGLYFPSVDATVNGNAFSGGSTCTEVVGHGLTFTGDSTLNLSGCSADGTPVAETQTVHLVM